MKRKFLISVALCLSALILLSCTNLLDAEKKSSDTTGISLTLPYAKANNEGVSRAGQNSGNKRSLHFSVTFRHESGDEKSFEGESGETILFENIITGNYSINVKAYDDNKVLIYEGNSEALVKEGKTTSVTIKLNKLDIIEINLLSHTDEQAGMIEKYIKEHPDCGIQLNFKKIETTNGEYSSFLDAALTGVSNEFIPDIYSAESAFVKRYTSGAMGGYALPYSDFIPDLDTKLQDAKIAQYTVDIGKNSSDQVVGLAYQTTGGVFIYRRSVAKDVFGSDDPKSVSSKIGGGSGNWNAFWSAASKCRDKGVAILSGADDLWHPLEGSASNSWIKDGQLYIDPEREAFLDYAKDLYDNNWTNKTEQWNPEWTADIRKEGEKPVLGFFGPAWLINFVLEPACESDDRDWAICEAPVGFSWGGTWLMANKKLLDDKSEEGKKKLEAVKNILEWITLDATEEGLQYQWANGLLGNAGDTVASELVMENSDGSLNFLNGQNMFDYYIPANKKAPSGLITEYDEKITQLWIFEANKYAQGLSSREQALNNFRFAVYCQLGLMSDGFNSEDFVYETEHVRAEPAPDGKGVQFTLSCKEGESWEPGASFIWESKNHIGIRIENVPTPGNPVVCYYPLTKDKEGYGFDCDLKISSKEMIHESLFAIANGGNEFLDFKAQNFNISLSGGQMKLSNAFSYEINKSDNVKPYFQYDVYTTNEKTDENNNIEWNQYLNHGHLQFNDEVLSSLEKDGAKVLTLNDFTYSRLQQDSYYFVNLTLEYTIDGYPESFRTWISPYSGIIKFDLKNIESDTTEHVHAEPAPDGKGVKLTISAKEGEEWKNDWYRVTEIKSGMYIQFKDNSVPTPGNPVVCYWPFTNNGESYVFDCELKINNDSDEAIHETLYSVANGNYAQVSVNSDGVNGFKPQITDLTNPKVTLSKDIRSSVTTSGNVTAAYDFGVCTTDENGNYKWIDWLNSIGPEFTDSILYDSARGITILNYDKDTVFKLKKNKHLYIDLNLEFNVEGLSECYRYKESFKSDIYDASSVISSLSTNQHISVAPHAEGIQVTLRYLPGEAEWVDRNDVICLTEDGQDGVTFHVDVLSNFEDEQVPASHRENLAPTAATPVKTYIFPFTQKDKEYEFILAGPLDKNEGWQNEYVCCKAGGGVGELIDVDAWNKDIKVTDIDYQNHSFRISGDVASIIDNSSKVFSSAFLWPDVRPGVDGNCRDKKFGYASRRLCIIGESDEYNRTLSDLERPLLIENSPAFVNGELAPDDYDNENVFAVLQEWNNKFWVIMTIEEIQLTAYPEMTFHLHWK